MQKLTDERYVEFRNMTFDTLEKVFEFIDPRLEWANEMMESYQKKHLIEELSTTKERLEDDFFAKNA